MFQFPSITLEIEPVLAENWYVVRII